jgi:glutamate dehydrogenase
VRLKIQEILKRHLGGTSAEFTVQLSDAALARIHMLVRSSPKESRRYDIRAIESDIAQATRRWEDDLKNALVDAVGEERAISLYRTYATAFPIAYRDRVTARTAVRDVHFIEALTEAEPFAVSLYRPVESDDRTLRLRVYRNGRPVPLSGSLPILENMGFEVLDEDNFEIRRPDHVSVFLHDFGMRSARPIPDVEAIKALTEDALRRIARGEIESDGFNRLTPGAAIGADDVTVIRAYAKYLKQTGFTFSQAYLEQTLAAHPQTAGESGRALPCALQSRARGEARCAAAADRRRDQGGVERRAQCGRGPDPAPLLQPGALDAAHEPLGARSRRGAQVVRLPQARLEPGARAARSAAALRDLGVLDEVRGDPPARRQGGARRVALVRPPGGFPHRDPRAS